MQATLRIILLCFCAIFSNVALSDEPEKLTQQYYLYIKNSEWQNLANIMDSDALKEFKQSLLPLFEQEATRKQSFLVERILGKGSTLQQARESSDNDFFQRSIQNVVGLLRSTQYKLRDAKVLGNIAEGKDIAHVMVKETSSTGDHEMQTIEVFTFRKSKDGWKLLLSGKLANFVQTARFNSEHANK